MQKRFESLYAMLLAQSTKNLDKIALVDNNKSYTYGDLINYSVSFARDLKRLFKVKKGDRVIILLPNIAAYAISIFAANKLGAIAVLVNTRLDNDSIEYIIDDTNPKVIITTQDLAPKIKKGISLVRLLLVESSSKYFSPVSEDIEIPVRKGKYVSLSKPEDVALIMYTSGTTGIPKGAMMTNSNLFFNCISSVSNFELSDNEVHLIVVPLFHVTGLNSQLLPSIFRGNTSVLLSKYRTIDVINLLEKYHISIFIAVPTVFILLLEKFSKELSRLKYLRKIGYAGAPMPVKTVLELKRALGNIKCYNFYGLTETSSISTFLPDKYAMVFPDSVGLPVNGVKLKIVGDNGKSLGHGNIGELLIKGGNIIKGYYGNKTASSKTIVNGWLKTGDLARFNNKGFVFLMGRKKEIINRGGEKIYPIALENKLANLPGVLETSVVGVDDKIFGQAVRICIVKKKNSKLNKRQVIQHARENFSEYEFPRDIIFLSKLPKNANGKVQKYLLSKL